jgi:hypothetical protein
MVNKVNKLVTVFANRSVTLDKSLIVYIAIAQEPFKFNSAPGSIPCLLSPLYRDTRKTKITPYRDCKNTRHTLLAP